MLVRSERTKISSSTHAGAGKKCIDRAFRFVFEFVLRNALQPVADSQRRKPWSWKCPTYNLLIADGRHESLSCFWARVGRSYHELVVWTSYVRFRHVFTVSDDLLSAEAGIGYFTGVQRRDSIQQRNAHQQQQQQQQHQQLFPVRPFVSPSNRMGSPQVQQQTWVGTALSVQWVG